MELEKAIQKRKSVRKFTKKKPDWRDIIDAIDSARYAPIAGNKFNLKFILVEDIEKMEALAEASQQPFVGSVHYIVVVVCDGSSTKKRFEGRGEMYCHQQSGAAIENFLLSLEESGLSTCWIGHFFDKKVKSVLGIPESVDVEAMFPIGYEARSMRTKRFKTDINTVVRFDSYGNKEMQNPSSLSA